MENLFGNLKPEHAAVIIGVVWVLREIFGFVRRVIEAIAERRDARERGGVEKYLSETDVQIRLIAETLKTVGDNIAKQTELLNRMVVRMDALGEKIEELELKFDSLSRGGAAPTRCDVGT